VAIKKAVAERKGHISFFLSDSPAKNWAGKTAQHAEECAKKFLFAVEIVKILTYCLFF